MQKKVCIFDFDGTLVDSMDQLTEWASQIMFDFYQMPSDEGQQRYRETSGLPFAKQLEVIFPGDSRNSEAAESFETKKQLHYFQRSFYQDTHDTIKYLKGKGFKVVISSGNQQEILTEFLAQKRLDCDLVLGYRPNFVKGAPHFNKISEEFHIDPKAMIFVGDSLHDAKAAYGSNIDFIGKEGLFSKQEFEQAHPGSQSIKNLSELKRIL